jgi:hypothetical protein
MLSRSLGVLGYQGKATELGPPVPDRIIADSPHNPGIRRFNA